MVVREVLRILHKGGGIWTRFKFQSLKRSVRRFDEVSIYVCVNTSPLDPCRTSIRVCKMRWKSLVQCSYFRQGIYLPIIYMDTGARSHIRSSAPHTSLPSSRLIFHLQNTWLPPSPDPQRWLRLMDAYFMRLTAFVNYCVLCHYAARWFRMQTKQKLPPFIHAGLNLIGLFRWLFQGFLTLLPASSL